MSGTGLGTTDRRLHTPGHVCTVMEHDLDPPAAHAPASPACRPGGTAGARGGAGEVIEAHRRELHAHCYRMLGSVHDADDAVQESLLRAWRGLPAFAGRSSLRTWLFRIATNVCLTAIERRPRAPIPIDPDRPLIDQVMIDPYPDSVPGAPGGATPTDVRYDRHESVELAFVAAVQLLPATQRAVVLLRDVLGFSARETAAALDTSVASVTSALQRGRTTLRARLPDRSEQANLRALGDAGLRTLVDRYVRAWETGDVQALVALLAADATFSMPPGGAYCGRAEIAAFLPAPLGRRWRLAPARVSGHVAFACYLWDDDAGAFRAHSVDVIGVRHGVVGEIAAFIDDRWVRRLGFPERWSADGPARRTVDVRGGEAGHRIRRFRSDDVRRSP